MNIYTLIIGFMGLIILGLIIIILIITKNAYNYIYKLINIIKSNKTHIENTLIHMNILDKKHMFERDDEVGILWVKIMNTLKDLERNIIYVDENIKD